MTVEWTTTAWLPESRREYNLCASCTWEKTRTLLQCQPASSAIILSSQAVNWVSKREIHLFALSCLTKALVQDGDGCFWRLIWKTTELCVSSIFLQINVRMPTFYSRYSDDTIASAFLTDHIYLFIFKFIPCSFPKGLRAVNNNVSQ